MTSMQNLIQIDSLLVGMDTLKAAYVNAKEPKWLDTILEDFDRKFAVASMSEMAFFNKPSDLVKVWKITVTDVVPAEDCPIDRPGTYYVKFQYYYEGGFHEAYINEFLQERPHNRVVAAIATGQLMLDHNGQMMPDVFSYMITSDAGTALADLEQGLPSPISLDLWITSTRELAESLRALAEDGSHDNPKYKFFNVGVSQRTVGISTEGLKMFNFSRAMLDVEVNGQTLLVLPSTPHRQSGYPGEDQCVDHFKTAVLGGLDKVTFSEGDKERLNSFRAVLEGKGGEADAASFKALVTQLRKI